MGSRTGFSLSKLGIWSLMVASSFAAVWETTPSASASEMEISLGIRDSKSVGLDPESGHPIDIGSGYNSVSAQVRGRCVERGELKPILGDEFKPGGQMVEFNLTEIDSFESLQQSLKMDVAASFGSGVFSADAKVGYYTSSNFNQQNFFLIVQVRATNMTLLQKEAPRLTKEARKALKKGTQRFLEMCGDQFVASVVTGGEFTAIIEIGTKSREDKESLRVELNAGGLTWSASAEVESKLHKISQSHSMKVHILRKGTHEDLVLKPTEVIEYARTFPRKVATGPNSQAWPYLVMTQDYGVIGDLPEEPSVLDMQRLVLTDMANQLAETFKRRNEILYVINHPKQFVKPDLDELERAAGRIAKLINTLNRAYIECSDNLPKQCVLPGGIDLPEVELPERVGANEGVSAFSFGAAVCDVQDPSHCIGLSNRPAESVIETGMRIREGAILELQPAWLIQQDFHVPAPVTRRIDRKVCTRKEPVYKKSCEWVCELSCINRCTKQKVGEKCVKTENQWSEITRYPDPVIETRLHAPVPAAGLQVIGEGLKLRFVAADPETNELHESICPIGMFEWQSDAPPGAVRFRLENLEQCSPFLDDPRVSPSLSLVNEIKATPVKYRKGRDVLLWNGTRTERSTETEIRPLSILSGEISKE